MRDRAPFVPPDEGGGPVRGERPQHRRQVAPLPRFRSLRGCVTVAIAFRGRRARSDQLFHDVGVPVVAREVKRRVPIIRFHRDARARNEEHAHHRFGPARACVEQGRVPIAAPLLDSSAAAQQCRDRFGVTSKE